MESKATIDQEQATVEQGVAGAENVASGNPIVKVGKKYGTDGRIPPGTQMKNQGWVISTNNEFVFIMQTEGNLVLYRVIGKPPEKEGDVFEGQAVWSTGTVVPPNPGEFFAFQWPDGNLVVYGVKGPAWNAGTQVFPGIPVALEVSTEGQLNLYKTQVVWSMPK